MLVGLGIPPGEPHSVDSRMLYFPLALIVGRGLAPAANICRYEIVLSLWYY